MDARLALLRWNRTAAPEPKMSPQLASEIRETLREDTLAFGRLVGRDLSHWLGGIGPGGEPAP
jgi:hypothetical protein